MPHLSRFSRRDLLRTALVAGATLALPIRAHAGTCSSTAAQEEGPFYMNSYDRTAPIANQTDLTRLPGASRSADGEVIHVAGRVLDQKCQPVKGMLVEIWQACVTGRYAHVLDPNPAPADPHFRYFGQMMTGEDGTYTFKTIKPGSYPVGPFERPPHIHFKITGGFYPVLVTQMYFAGEALNAKDPLINTLPKAEQQRLIIEPARRPGSSEENLFTFDVALGSFELPSGAAMPRRG
ncbi:MAG: hypothetical protein ETSY2_30615 [Candidatus Entotheonella gemina]|uniref:Intradiol ring-cleavage dioxygenases domain-containing protein n=1 Tax=Candidatus Entotheonella gemina TaxID=1429439 RepID=W4M1Q1_9BACT|nr:MAG: hypothetical protein ETSY2_30615 [Candidatus Entotheonella gemina]